MTGSCVQCSIVYTCILKSSNTLKKKKCQDLDVGYPIYGIFFHLNVSSTLFVCAYCLSDTCLTFNKL